MELLPIGYFGKTHGVKGQLILKAEKDFLPERVKAIFVEMSGAKAPYFITEMKESNNGIIVGLEDITTVEKARTLLGKKVFIDASLVEKEENEEDWVGFELVDKNHGSLGKIREVTDNGAQTLVLVMHMEKEIILPMVEAFVDKIDEAAKQIFYNAPEGLLDVYLDAGSSGDEG